MPSTNPNNEGINGNRYLIAHQGQVSVGNIKMH